MTYSFLLILLAIYFAAGVLPFYKFRNHYFIRYFIAIAVIDPFYYILYHYNIISRFTNEDYLSYATIIILWAFPYKKVYIKLFLSIPLLVSTLHFQPNLQLLQIFYVTVEMFLIYCLIEYLINEIDNCGKGSLFLVLLTLLTLQDAIYGLLTLETITPGLIFHSVFWSINIVLLISVAIAGTEKKIKIPSFFLKKMNLKFFENENQLNSNNNVNLVRGTKSFDNDLCERELTIIKLITKGLTSREIADKLYLSKKTIDFYRGNIKSKLNITKKSDLVTFYNTNIEHGGNDDF